jgi:hypothetical protein
MKKAILGAVLAGVILSLAALASAEEVTYRKQIKPLFDAKCAACHGAEAAPEYGAFKEEKTRWLAKGQGMKMDTYSHLLFYTAWPGTGAIMRRLNDGQGAREAQAGNMYPYLGDREEERQKNLKLFKEWVGNWTLKKRNEITQEDLAGIKAAY